MVTSAGTFNGRNVEGLFRLVSHLWAVEVRLSCGGGHSESLSLLGHVRARGGGERCLFVIAVSHRPNPVPEMRRVAVRARATTYEVGSLGHPYWAWLSVDQRKFLVGAFGDLLLTIGSSKGLRLP